MSSSPANPPPSDSNPSNLPKGTNPVQPDLEEEYRQMEEVLGELPALPDPARKRSRRSNGLPETAEVARPTLVLVETAFLASTASLLWLASYYLSLVPWMRILFPAPIALAYLRWGQRASWMSALVTGLLLSVLMGPYLSLLFIVPYGLIGVQLGAMWKRQTPWGLSILTGTLLSSFGFFFRVGLLSSFLGEDLWVYLTSRITDFLDWVVTMLVGWGVLGVGALGQVNLAVVQLVTIGIVLLSDLVYLFTVHLASWLLLERLGNPIPDPPRWVQVILEED